MKFVRIATVVAAILGCAPVMACVNAPGFICINEMLVQTSGGPAAQRTHEYVELRGEPSATIPAGTYLVSVDGDKNQNPGTMDVVIDLAGKSFGSNGFLVLLASGNGYQSPNQVNPNASVEVSAATGLSGIVGWSS